MAKRRKRRTKLVQIPRGLPDAGRFISREDLRALKEQIALERDFPELFLDSEALEQLKLERYYAKRPSLERRSFVEPEIAEDPTDWTIRYQLEKKLKREYATTAIAEDPDEPFPPVSEFHISFNRRFQMGWIYDHYGIVFAAKIFQASYFEALEILYQHIYARYPDSNYARVTVYWQDDNGHPIPRTVTNGFGLKQGLLNARIELPVWAKDVAYRGMPIVGVGMQVRR